MLSPISLSKSMGHTLGPELRVCILLTPQSRLIAYASSPPNAEDLMKILLSLSAEAWRDAELHHAQAQSQAQAQGQVRTTPSATSTTAANNQGPSLAKEDEFVRLDCELGRVIIMPVYPTHGGTMGMGLSPSSSFQSDSLDLLDATTPKPGAASPVPAPIIDGLGVGWKSPSQSQAYKSGSETSSEGSRGGSGGSPGGGSGGGVKFLLALNAPSSVPWGLIRAKGRHLRTFLSTSLGEVGERLESKANASPPNGAR